MNSLPKPEPHAKVKARNRRDKQVARRACWLFVYERERGRCQGCGKGVKRVDDPSATEWDVGHCHEPEKRSHGADPTDQSQVVLLCRVCHLFTHEGA